MGRFLYKVGRSAYLYKWRFIALWLLVVVGMSIGASFLAKPPNDSLTIPGLESVQAQEEIKDKFQMETDQISLPQGSIVVRAPEGKTLEDQQVAAQVDSLIQALKDSGSLTGTEELLSPVPADAGMREQLKDQKSDADLQAISPLSPDKTTGVIEVSFDAQRADEVTEEQQQKVVAAINNNKGDLQVGYSDVIAGYEMPGMQSELIGIAVAAVVLLITFGSFVIAGMPLITAIIGVSIGLSGIGIASGLTDSVGSSTSTLATMLGLAVGIDYALFIVSRFRSELVKTVAAEQLTPKQVAAAVRGVDVDTRADAAGRTLATAGSAVVFAGLTVIIALVAVTVIGIPMLTTMTLAAAGTVAFAVLVALTLLPAILGVCGARVFAGAVPLVSAPDPERTKPTVGLHWVRMLRRRPALFLVASVAVLGVLAVPMMQLNMQLSGDATAKPGSPTRVAYDLTAEAFGGGRNDQIVALVDVAAVPADSREAAFGVAVDKLGSVEGVQNAQPVALNQAGDAAQVLITPEFGATDERTGKLLEDIRSKQSEFNGETGGRFVVTGLAPISEDVAQRLNASLVPYVLIVLVLAFLLLMVVFRSIWVPLVAAMGFALTLAATFGITVAVWQEGFAGLVTDTHALDSFLPIILIGIVFGLAMDYQVFLVSRMREGFDHGKSAGDAVSNGFKHGARVVTAAALIMISVFAAFMLIDLRLMILMGFALAVAVFLDAFIVRMTLMPAIMFLLGERAWRIPCWLDRVLPRVVIEEG